MDYFVEYGMPCAISVIHAGGRSDQAGTLKAPSSGHIARDTMDTEAGKSAKGPEKHDISSYVSPKGARKVQMVESTQVEGKRTESSVRMGHIVKIFKDDDDFIEGTLCVRCRLEPRCTC
jgi:hypothetical protein